MGLASMLLGEQNPFSKFVADNRNAIRGFAGGFANGPTIESGLQNAVQYTARGQQMDDVNRQQLKVAEEQAAQKTATQKWLAQKFPDLAQMVEAGMPMSEAWQTATQRMQPQTPTDPTTTATGRQGLAQQYGLTGADAQMYVLTGKLPDAAGGMKPPTVETRFNPETGLPEKVSWNSQTGQWDAFGGQQAPRGASDLTATETKKLFETEDNIAAAQNVLSSLDTAISLNDTSRDGFGADFLSTVGANVPDWIPGIGGGPQDANTMQLKNLVTEQALSQLKLIFGGQPTEGERKILLEIQGSVDQPAEVRKRIFERAKQMAQTRLQFNQQRKAKIESGGYGQTVPADGSAPAMRGNGWSVVGVE